MTDQTSAPASDSPEDIRPLLARVAKEWLTFERLRQELLNLGAIDPLVVSPASRDVERVIKALMDDKRDPVEVEKVRYALLRSLSGHPAVAKLRYQSDASASVAADASGASASALQAMLRARDDVFARWASFQEGMQRVGPVVCQVFIGSQFQGTGFLISDRHVLTAHHCIKGLLDSNGAPIPNRSDELTLIFDDIALPEKSGGAFRSTFNAASAWLAFDSKQDDNEDTAPTPLDDVADGRLDFSVIALDKPAGLTAPAYQRGKPRKWLDIMDLAAAPAADAQMLIAHYPGGADLRLSVGLFDTHSHCSRRIRYRTPAIVGSSGAPCFTVDWKPYALHNAGYAAAHLNQGVPLSLIVQAIGDLQELQKAQTRKSLLPAVTSSGEPILGRPEIAERVDAMLSGTSDAVALVVTSDGAGGKTFTAELIRSMVLSRGHAAFILDAEKFAADAPEAFARRLVEEVAGGDGGDPIPREPDTRQRARWISRSLSSWTRSRVIPRDASADESGDKKRTLWIILDRCDKVTFSQEAHDLLVALIADDEPGADQPIRFMLIGYGGDLGAIPTGELWKTHLNLISVPGVMPYMEYVLASLSPDEDAETVRAGATEWVASAAAFGIVEIPKVIQGLKGWEAQRRSRRQASADTSG